MPVSRIQKLDIDNRPPLTGICGLTSLHEYFVDNDLRSYCLWEELYLYLHEKGYITVFYNIEDNEFSYQERDLAFFFRKNEVKGENHQVSRSQTSQHRRHDRCRGPLGLAHPYSPANNSISDSNALSLCTHSNEVKSNTNVLQSHYSGFQVHYSSTKGDFFQTKKRKSGIEFLERCIRHAEDDKGRKIAVVFTTPETTEVESQQYGLAWQKIRSYIQGHGKANLSLRILVLYSSPDPRSLFDSREKAFFYLQDFKNIYFPNSNHDRLEVDQTTLFCIGRPEIDEIGNVLNKRRIENNGLAGLFDIPFDVVCSNFWQNYPLKDEKGKNLIGPNTKSERTIESAVGFMRLPKEVLESTLLEMGKMEDFSMELLSRALSKVHGQQDSMKIIVSNVCTWIRRPDDKKVPLVLMLAGTSGTGKTFTVETLSNTLRSYGYLFVKLPMNEYKSAGDTWKLLGSAAGHVGSDQDAPLFAARKESERLVILFDEIEKAHESIFETIMTLMEKGELTNGRGEAFDFRQSIIFFTTNLAMNELLERKKELISSGNKLESYLFQQSVKDILRNNRVKPEVCGRIDTVLIYNTLTKETVARIAIEEIRDLGRIYNRSINNIAKSLLVEIINQTADSREGARPIKKLVRDKFEPIFQQ